MVLVLISAFHRTIHCIIRENKKNKMDVKLGFIWILTFTLLKVCIFVTAS